MTRALVTGGTGFIGSHVVRQLLKQKISVRCLVRATSKRSNLDGLGVEYVIGDLQDAGSLTLALRHCDMLFHVAADYRLWAPHPEQMNRVNVEGTRQLFQAAGDAGLSKIVYTSSVAAVGRGARSEGGVGVEELVVFKYVIPIARGMTFYVLKGELLWDYHYCRVSKSAAMS